MLKLNKLLSYSFKSLSKVNKFRFSTDTVSMPVIDMDKFMNKREGWESECKLTADCLHETGILVVKDTVRDIKS